MSCDRRCRHRAPARNAPPDPSPASPSAPVGEHCDGDSWRRESRSRQHLWPPPKAPILARRLRLHAPGSWSVSPFLRTMNDGIIDLRLQELKLSHLPLAAFCRNLMAAISAAMRRYERCKIAVYTRQCE